MPRVGFEPTISAGERPKTYALDRAATGTGLIPTIRKVKYDSDFYKILQEIDIVYDLQLYLQETVKFTLEQTMKAQRGSRGIVLLFLQPRR